MELVYILINLLIFGGLMYFVHFLRKKGVSFSKAVMIALALGLAYGYFVKIVTPDYVTQTMSWVSVVGTIYLRSLQMIVIPLIFVSITKSFIGFNSEKGFAKITGVIIASLLLTTAIAAFVGFATAMAFNLDENQIAVTSEYEDEVAAKEEKLATLEEKPLSQTIAEIIPTNILYAFSGQGPSATLSVVVVTIIFALAAMKLRKRRPESFAVYEKGIYAIHDLVMIVVKFVIKLSPYAIIAMISEFVATSDANAMKELVVFVIASYVAIFIMFIVHGLIISLLKLNPIKFFRNGLNALIFAFSSRSSSGTLPITVSCLEDNMGVSEETANLSASLSTCIGQNGCAGIYPAMVAVMVAASAGVEINLQFLITLIIVITICSFGVAGVGGGATNSSLIVLSTMGLPIDILGVLTSVEPVIDMARTALNVSGGMVTGCVTGVANKCLDREVFKSEVKKTN